MVKKNKNALSVEVSIGVDVSAQIKGTCSITRDGKEIADKQYFKIPRFPLSVGAILVHKVSSKTFIVLEQQDKNYVVKDIKNGSRFTIGAKILKQSCWVWCITSP